MEGKRQLLKRNQRMDLYRGVAIYGVVAIHVLFPGSFGEAVRALARYAVPFFFLTAGYFNFNASSRGMAKRAGRTVGQLAFATLLYLLLGCLLALLRGEKALDWLKPLWKVDYLLEFLQYHTIPFPYAWQLWFLGAMVIVYLFWWAVTTLYEAGGGRLPYDAFAVLAAVLLVVHLVLGEGSALLGREMDNRVLRSAFLDGLPCFLLGSWAAWRRRDIKALALPWHWLILGGGALSLVEAAKLGRQELYLGTVILLVGLMGRCIRYRRASGGWLSQALRFCGQELTLPIFVVHMAVLALIREIPALAGLNELTWLLPVVVAGVSTLIALGWAWGQASWKERRNRW